MRSARLRDIAESAGCSVAVASHVVNGSAGNISCSPALRERILRKAAELGYAPQHAGLALRSRRAGAIGLYVPPTPDASLSGAYEARVFAGVERVALERGLDVLVVGGPDAASGARICLAKLASRRIDGIVLLRVPAAARWARSFAGLDAVAVDYAGAAPLDTVVCDVRDAAALAVGELLRLGHRRIAFLGPVDGVLPAVAGFRRALAAHGLPDDPRWNLRPPRGSGFRLEPLGSDGLLDIARFRDGHVHGHDERFVGEVRVVHARDAVAVELPHRAGRGGGADFHPDRVLRDRERLAKPEHGHRERFLVGGVDQGGIRVEGGCDRRQ